MDPFTKKNPNENKKINYFYKKERSDFRTAIYLSDTKNTVIYN